MDWNNPLAVAGSVALIVVVIILKPLVTACLKNWIEDQQLLRATSKETQDKRIASDRATYNKRLCCLILCNLATYVRYGKWLTDEEDLQRLLVGLENGGWEPFLDEDVNQRWQDLIETTVTLAKKRFTGAISEQDIQAYNEVRRQWDDAAKRSFGPLPETLDFPRPRHDPSAVTPGRQAA